MSSFWSVLSVKKKSLVVTTAILGVSWVITPYVFKRKVPTEAELADEALLKKAMEWRVREMEKAQMSEFDQQQQQQS